MQKTSEKDKAAPISPRAFLMTPDTGHRLGPGRNVLILTAAAVSAYLYLQNFVLPVVPVLQRDDQITFIVNAARMLHGEMIYSDFFQYTPPGTDLVYLGLFKIFGVRAWIASAVVLSLGIAAFCICYWAAVRVMPRLQACLAAAVFTVFVFASMGNATHHWYSALLVMCATLSVLARRTPARLAGAGMFMALASFFTQTRVVSLLALALFVAWAERKQHREWRDVLKHEASLLLGFACGFLLLNFYYLRHAGLELLFSHQIVALSRSAFVFKYSLLGFPSVPPWYLAGRAAGFLMVYLLVPAIYIYSLICLIRKPGRNYSDRDTHILLLSVIGGALFLEVLPAPNWVRLFPISMPAIILAMYYVAGERRVHVFIRRSLWAATAIVALLCTISAQARPHRTLDLPVGRAAVYDENISSKLADLVVRTRPGDFFFEAAWLDLYFPLELRNPSYLDALSPSSTPAQVQNVVEALERRQVKYVLWSARLDIRGADSAGNDALAPARMYLRRHYRVVEHFPPAEDLWERTIESPATSLSAGRMRMIEGHDNSAASGGGPVEIR